MEQSFTEKMKESLLELKKEILAQLVTTNADFKEIAEGKDAKDDVDIASDVIDRKLLYVGMTRAKNNLYIHTNTSLFDSYTLNGVVHRLDKEKYQEPSSIVIQTTHRDVVLDFFKSKKETILSLPSGTKLNIDDVYLTAQVNGKDLRVAKFSKNFCEYLSNLKDIICLEEKLVEIKLI